MIATLHEIEFTYDGVNYMVSGDVEGPTDAPDVEFRDLKMERDEGFRLVTLVHVDHATLLANAAEDALIEAAEAQRLIYSCECCGGEFYGRPSECSRCEDRIEAEIDKARGK